jgi:hypothetical protein
LNQRFEHALFFHLFYISDFGDLRRGQAQQRFAGDGEDGIGSACRSPDDFKAE